MPKNEKAKFYSSVISFLIISGFLIWFGMVNLKNTINGHLAEIKSKKTIIIASDLREKSLSASNESYGFSKSKVEEFNNYFVYANDNDDAEFSSFFEQLDDPVTGVAAQTGNSVSIELYQKDAPLVKNKKNVNEQSDQNNTESRLIRLTVLGSFEGLLKFIYFLEGMPYYIYIESMNVNKTGNIEKGNNLSGKDNNLQSVLIIKVFKKQI